MSWKEKAEEILRYFYVIQDGIADDIETLKHILKMDDKEWFEEFIKTWEED